MLSPIYKEAETENKYQHEQYLISTATAAANIALQVITKAVFKSVFVHSLVQKNRAQGHAYATLGNKQCATFVRLCRDFKC